MDLDTIVFKLTGPIQPVGETYEDDRRYQNLQSVIELTDKLLGEISTVAHNKDRAESSMSKAGKLADQFLQDVRDV